MPGKPHPPEVRAEAVERMRGGETLASVERSGDVPRSTLARWASDAGIDVGLFSSQTRAARDRIMAMRDLDRATRAIALDAVADAYIGEAAERARDGTASDADLREVVGAWTRAIHDAELLAGEATARHEHAAVPERTPEQEQEFDRVLRLVADTDAA